MTRVDYDKILNHWKIYDEAQRWSVKSLFKSTVRHQTNESFDLFLKNEVGKNVSGKRKIF